MAAESVAYPTGRFLTGLSRPGAFLVVTGCYLLAAGGAVVAGYAGRHHHPLTVALLADVVATVVVFAASMVGANSSLYDPYWSVAPPLVAVYWVASGPGGVAARQAVVVGLVAAWAVRLTGNWARGWRGWAHEDWRYVRLREQAAGRVPWWLVSLTGIQLMPTLVVFAGMLPLWPALAAGRHALGPLDLLAGAVTGTAILVEAVADGQLRRFARDQANRGRIADRGLWSRSRHPNYLGEIGFWWGLWLFGLAAAPAWWWTVIGPLVMVLLFETVSIPLMERRLRERRPGYPAYRVAVPRLLPRPGRGPVA